MPISVPAFNLALCTSGPFLTTDCVPQPGTTAILDTLGDRLMYRLAHFDEHGTQHFLVTHSVNNTTAVAARWYEFRAQGLGTTSLSLYQSGQTPDDGEYRWMGSVAMDQAGDIAIGYSRSSAAPGDYPSIYYAGQTAGDPLGTTETEALIKQGRGSQPDTGDRWGDYSSMALDGADSCTFWYTNEYYDTNQGSLGLRGSLRSSSRTATKSRACVSAKQERRRLRKSPKFAPPVSQPCSPGVTNCVAVADGKSIFRREPR